MNSLFSLAVEEAPQVLARNPMVFRSETYSYVRHDSPCAFWLEARGSECVWHLCSSMAREARERARELAFYALDDAFYALDDRYRMSVVEELLNLGKHAAPAVPALTKCLEVPQDFIRRSAIHALGSLGEHAASAVEVLITYLKHRRSYVRC